MLLLLVVVQVLVHYYHHHWFCNCNNYPQVPQEKVAVKGQSPDPALPGPLLQT
jgi:hypothetical protein